MTDIAALSPEDLAFYIKVGQVKPEEKTPTKKEE